jgi:hypothetical protein
VDTEEAALAKRELLGKTVVGRDGAYLGHVVAVGFRRGELRRIGVQKDAGDPAFRFFRAGTVQARDSRLEVDAAADR